jgi:hypothetical protein
VLPAGAEMGRQHVVLPAPWAQNAAAVQAMAPQQKMLGGAPGAQKGGTIWAPVNGLVPGQHCWDGAAAHAVVPQHCGKVGGAHVPGPKTVSGQQKLGALHVAGLHAAFADFCCSATSPTVPSAPPTASFIACRRDIEPANNRVMASNRSPLPTAASPDFAPL